MREYEYLLAIFFVSVLGGMADAMIMGPTSAPVDRLITNTEAYIKENPGKSQGYYTLARVHYLAFVHKALLVGAYDAREDEKPLPNVAADDLQGNIADESCQYYAKKLAFEELGYSSEQEVPREQQLEYRNLWRQKEWQLRKEGRKQLVSDEQLVNHAAAAVRNFNKAIELDPNNGLYHLGLASLLEQYVGFLTEIKVDEMPEEFRSIILEKAKDSYYAAYECSIRKDLKRKYKPMIGLQSLVGYEAAKAYIRLSQARKSISEDELKRLSVVKKDLKRLEGLPESPIVTPIVLSLEETTSISQLLRPSLRVRFDLDGDAVVEAWPWVRPTTGILVWDPQGKGTVTSGRQMFGSVSWWLFFEDGYHALDALDDSRDGILSGDELSGISVWFDRNSNGKSEPGEVLPVEQLQIVSLATRSWGHDGDCPMNRSGLALADGRMLATYDWIVTGEEKGAKR